MSDIVIKKINEVYVRVESEPAIAFELADHFTFTVPGFQYTPKYQAGIWDGKIRLFNSLSGKIYAGLIHEIENYAKNHQYSIEIDPVFANEQVSLLEAQEAIESFGMPKQYFPRDYQLDAFLHCVRHRRALLLSPTASGKSLIIYLLIRWRVPDKTLIIVPTTALIHQMYSDFEEYGFDSKSMIHKIYQGQEKEADKFIYLSTWQSIYDMPKRWFEQFKMVIGDEAHQYKAQSLKTIMENLIHCPYRFGTTGTLDGTKIHKWVLEGLFGPLEQVTTTKKLMENEVLAKLHIKAIVLSYSDKIRKLLARKEFSTEKDFIVRYQPRNFFIRNLILSLKGNILVLYEYVDKHGKVLYNLLNEKAHFVSGNINGTDREKIRQIVLKNDNSIIIASYGTFSTGINIPNLDYIITASPAKSRIRVLQSIGRGLRKTETKKLMTVFDIADDLRWKKWTNHTLKHFQERIGIYNKEGFDYKYYNVKVGE